MGSRGQQRLETHRSDQSGFLHYSRGLWLFPKAGKEVGFTFFLSGFVKSPREWAQEDHPYGAKRRVRTQEGEPHAALVCVWHRALTLGCLRLSCHSKLRS